MQNDAYNGENKWWNKLAEMSREDMELLPHNFVRKYGSYLEFMQRYDAEARLDENRRLNYYAQIKNLKTLLT